METKMTVQEIIETAMTNPTRFFDPHFMLGVYGVDWYSDRVVIQAHYSGELIRELPQQLINTASIKLGTGFTKMVVTTTEEIPDGSDRCYSLEFTLT
jgi:hypothetical protein